MGLIEPNILLAGALDPGPREATGERRGGEGKEHPEGEEDEGGHDVGEPPSPT